MRNTRPRETAQSKEPIKTEIQISQSSHYSGPLPLPEDLARYDQIVPGAADRIIKMAENEMSHRHENDNRLAKNIVRTTVMSILAAFLCVLIMAGIVFYALYKDFPGVAGTIAVGSIAAIAGVFFKQKANKENNH